MYPDIIKQVLAKAAFPNCTVTSVVIKEKKAETVYSETSL